MFPAGYRLISPPDHAVKGPKKFLGGTFFVESYGDLERATGLPGSSGIQELVDAPGGGFFVTVHDPEGFPLNLMYGQEKREEIPDEKPRRLAYNFENEKPRVREFLRFKAGPAAVYKVCRLQSGREILKANDTNYTAGPLWFVCPRLF